MLWKKKSQWCCQKCDKWRRSASGDGAMPTSYSAASVPRHTSGYSALVEAAAVRSRLGKQSTWPNSIASVKKVRHIVKWLPVKIWGRPLLLGWETGLWSEVQCMQRREIAYASNYHGVVHGNHMKVRSKCSLANCTKICTNKNFPLYSRLLAIWHKPFIFDTFCNWSTQSWISSLGMTY